MQKAEPQHGQTQHQPAAKQGGGLALASPQGEHIAQLEAAMDSSPQAEKLGALSSMMNASPAMAAQRKLMDNIHSSPRQAAQQKKFASLFGTAQRVEDEAPMQGKFASPAQIEQQPAENKPNNTGLPDNLKSGIENLSGMSMDSVKVHYNSSQPAQLNALAYAQGSDIHVAPGQEQHLPHEAWHVVQQAQGRVRPTMQMKDGIPVNNDTGLEHEADVMGGKALQAAGRINDAGATSPAHHAVVQREIIITKDQLVYPTGEIAFKALKSTFHDIATGDLLVFLQNLCAKQSIFHDFRNFKYFVETEIIKPRPGLRITRDQLEYPTAETAFNALRSTFQDVANEDLFNFLYDLCSRGSVFHDFRNFKQFADTKMKTMQAGPGLKIEEVMKENDLPSFIASQVAFQNVLKSMNGLRSAGFEYEFASFTGGMLIPYSAVEIIPSHQLMGKSKVLGNYFGLPWRLESDAFNTLELVTPPLVFPMTQNGDEKRKKVNDDLAGAAKDIAGKLATGTPKNTLLELAGGIELAGLGTGWEIDGKYQQYGAVKKDKGGAKVYDQTNVSLYAPEIGGLLEDQFKQFDKPLIRNVFSGTAPENVARKVRYALGFVDSEGVSQAVTHAAAIFARYASNALAIPSMKYRQDTRVRKDPMPTQVKETLGIWVKTDAMNLLKDILTTPQDQSQFCDGLSTATEVITGIFNLEGTKMIAQAKTDGEEQLRLALENELKLANVFNSLPPKTDEKPMDRIARAKGLIELGTAKIKDENSAKIVKMIGYVALMVKEVAEFIDRAKKVATHQHSGPRSTTKDFLSEEYGTGEGVRKGTYLPGVRTQAGTMYVTELR